VSKLFIVDVGHGNASIVQENNVTVVIDTGLKGRLREFLHRRGVDEIECVILSHSDADHISGLAGLLVGGIKVKTVVLNADADKETEAWRDLIFALDGAHERGELEFRVGLTDGPLAMQGFSDTSLEVAAPTRLLAAFGVGAKDRNGKTITSNSLSAVIRILYKNVPIALLTGDMDEVTLAEITTKRTDIRARFLVFPHHGGLPGAANPQVFTRMLMNAVLPESVLFSHGRDKHSNPHESVILEVINSQPGVRIGCTQLSKRCAKAVPGAKREFVYELFSSGEKEGLCCAGTMEIPLNEGEISDPTRSRFNEFVLQHVPDALCQRRP
jgi:beta-lactamase superfamily II metal-dependent hydrolase